MWLLIAAAAATDYRVFWTELRAQAGWAEVGRKGVDGVGEVVIRHKQIQGQDCLEGTLRADADADRLLTAAADIPRQPSWSTWAVKESVRLGDAGAGFDYYQVLENPFPVNDRYWFVRATTRRSADERVFAWEALPPEAYAEVRAGVKQRFPDAVETLVNVGDWTFTPSPDGTTTVRYRLCTDVGGNIPRWAGEIAARTTLPTNLADIVREARRAAGR